jgi:hypothetical protein
MEHIISFHYDTPNSRGPEPSLNSIAAMMGVTKQTVRRYVQSLEAKQNSRGQKMVVVTRRGTQGKTSHYDFSGLMYECKRLYDLDNGGGIICDTPIRDDRGGVSSVIPEEYKDNNTKLKEAAATPAAPPTLYLYPDDCRTMVDLTPYMPKPKRKRKKATISPAYELLGRICYPRLSTDDMLTVSRGYVKKELNKLTALESWDAKRPTRQLWAFYYWWAKAASRDSVAYVWRDKTGAYRPPKPSEVLNQWGNFIMWYNEQTEARLDEIEQGFMSLNGGAMSGESKPLEALEAPAPAVLVDKFVDGKWVKVPVGGNNNG